MAGFAGCTGGDTSSGGTTGSTPESDDPVVFGIQAPFTGNPQIAQQERNGAKLAKEHVGDINGRPIEIRYRDTEANPQRSARNAREQLNEGADFLAGGISSAVEAAIARIAGQNEVLYMGSDAGSDKLNGEYTPDYYPYFFRPHPSAGMLARALARYASEDMSSGARVSGIDPDFIWGQSNWNAFQEEITDVADAEIVEHLWPDQGTREFGPFISQLEEIDPDVIFTSLFGSGLVAFTQQADSAGLFEDRLVVSAQYGMTIGNQLTDQSPTGLITAAIGYWYDLDNPTNNRFREDYVERYGSLPPGKAAGNYTAVKMLADAANKAGTVEDTDTIISTLENNSWDTAYGNLGFRKLDHQGYNPVPVGRMVGGDDPNWLRMEDKRIYPAEDVIRPTSEMKEIFCTGSTDNQELQNACDSY